MKPTDRYERLFYEALRIRLVEDRISALYPTDKIQSPVHLSNGQEAIAVGACESLKASDPLFCSYRSHAFYLAKGGDLDAMMAELFGKVTGSGKGKAGSMHLAAPEVSLFGSSAVVASTIPHAVGAALAAKRMGKPQVVLAVFGDGATEEGVYHECLNIAALHGLPVLFLCENNTLAIHSKVEARQAYRIQDLVAAYGIPTAYVAEGYDLLKVADCVGGLIGEIRSEPAPRFLEIKTFRYKEHVGPGEDYDFGYRSRAELEEWMSHDPLVNDQELVERFTSTIETEIDEAVLFAERSPEPGLEELLTDVL